MNKPLYAIVNSKTGKAQGDAYSLKSEAKSNAAALNQISRHDAKAGGMLEKFTVAEIHPEMATGLTINPYSR